MAKKTGKAGTCSEGADSVPWGSSVLEALLALPFRLSASGPCGHLATLVVLRLSLTSGFRAEGKIPTGERTLLLRPSRWGQGLRTRPPWVLLGWCHALRARFTSGWVECLGKSFVSFICKMVGVARENNLATFCFCRCKAKMRYSL